MDSTFIPAAVQDLWKVWNIRGFMILSICMQLILTLTARLRRKTSDSFIIFVVWSSYLLADWAALFVFGLISNAGCRHMENKDVQVPPDVMAFWAAFLLVHLGGPDTITAFSLEDNALWMRHLVGLIAQLSVFLYIFMKTLPNNRLLAPTVLIFVAGVINYGERTRALYLASLDYLKMKTKKETNVLKSKPDDKFFHHIAKGLASDIIPALRDCNRSWDLTSGYDHQTIFRKIESSLSILYELLYTKVNGAASRWGIVVRGISYHSTQVAFILFCLADKNGFREVDLAITYALFVGVFILQVANTKMLGTTASRDFSREDVIQVTLELGIFSVPLVFALVLGMAKILPVSAWDLLFVRTWSEKMGSFNMLFLCFKHCVPRRGHKLGLIWNKLAGERHTSREDFDTSLWGHVCEDIKRKVAGTLIAARMRELYDARGDQALEESDCLEMMPYIRDFEYKNTLLIWHVATEICFNIDEAEVVDDDDRKTKMRFSKKLSDYMMYLLVGQPKLMSAVAGISQNRYDDTCDELKLLGRRLGCLSMQEFCTSIFGENTNIPESSIKVKNHKRSVLKDSCRLVQILQSENYRNNRWEVIFKVWVELLSYAAGHCRVDLHLRLLSKGSEFITIVWMLMAFCGIRDQFPVERSSEEEDERSSEEEDDKEIGRPPFPVERSSEEEDDEEIGRHPFPVESSSKEEEEDEEIGRDPGI